MLKRNHDIYSYPADPNSFSRANYKTRNVSKVFPTKYQEVEKKITIKEQK